MSDDQQELDENEIQPDGQAEEGQGQGEETEEPEAQYELTAEDATSFSGAPAWFDRKKVIMVITGALVVIVLLGLIFSNSNSKKKQTATDAAWAANVPKDFLQRELERALANASPADRSEIDKLTADYNAGLISEEEYLRRLLELQDKATNPTTDQYGLPLVTSTGGRTPAPEAQIQYVPQQQQQQQQQTAQRQPQPQLSPLVPKVEGSLFGSQAAQGAMDPYSAFSNQAANPYADPYTAALMGQVEAANQRQAEAANSYASLLGRAGLSGLSQPDLYAAQNDQAGKNSFYNSAVSGGAIAGNFLQGNILWIGTIIPAVLETAINTDLPGNVIARVTENIYDSQTGKNILIPQGTILIARYNSSVSYQQHRVQVVWDVLIRPDGYQIELEGMNGVDPRGIAGLKAVYHENWFEYVKAAGIISLFSLINSKMVEQVAKYGSDQMAEGVITSNAEFIKEIGGNFISRALNIQPTLTIDNGEKINVMLNKNIYLPSFRNFEVKQRYVLP
jgi:type IV secretory pathway VirB10-like protein